MFKVLSLKCFIIKVNDDVVSEQDADYRPSEVNVVAELSEDDEDHYFDAMQESAREQQVRSDKGVEVIVPDRAIFEFVGISGHDILIDDENRKICTFKIEIRCVEATPSYWVVFRRYTHFRQLSEALLSHGFAVPPLPPKIVLGAFIAEFNVRRKVRQSHDKLHSPLLTHVAYTGGLDRLVACFV
jgi:hypothetical protein